MELATDDMLMMDPARAATMPGRKARIMWYMEFTLRSNAAFQVAGSTSSTVPLGTVPAQLNNTSTWPARAANAEMASAWRTSSTKPSQPATTCTALASISTASTRAPSRAKASALARPIPDAAAVTTAALPASVTSPDSLQTIGVSFESLATSRFQADRSPEVMGGLAPWSSTMTSSG